MPTQYLLEAERTEGRLEPGAAIGKWLHGFVLSLIAAEDHGVASRIHNQERTGFSLAPLANRDGILQFRMGVLEEEAILERALSRLPGLHFRIGNAVFLGKRAECVASLQDPFSWQGPSPRRLRFHFRAPATFRSQGRHLLFPEPQAVFSSISRSVERVYGMPLLPEHPESTSNVLVSEYELSTRQVSGGNFPLKGFVGWVQYAITRECPPSLATLLAMLARLAPYTGVGYHTRQGMGAVDTRWQ